MQSGGGENRHRDLPLARLREACQCAFARWKARVTPRIVSIVVAILVAGCDANPLAVALERLSGRERAVVVLAKHPILLASKPTVLSSNVPMQILSQSTSVCVSLEDGVELREAKAFDQMFAAAMANAQVKVELVLASGDRFPLGQPLPAWSRRRIVAEGNELAACASPRCEVELPIGALVSRIELSSEPALRVRGVYWRSEGMHSRKTTPRTPITAAPAADRQGSCGP